MGQPHDAEKRHLEAESQLDLFPAEPPPYDSVLTGLGCQQSSVLVSTAQQVVDITHYDLQVGTAQGIEVLVADQPMRLLNVGFAETVGRDGVG